MATEGRKGGDGWGGEGLGAALQEAMPPPALPRPPFLFPSGALRWPCVHRTPASCLMPGCGQRWQLGAQAPFNLVHVNNRVIKSKVSSGLCGQKIHFRRGEGSSESTSADEHDTVSPPPRACGLAGLFVFARQCNKLYYLMKHDPDAAAEANTRTVCL